MDPSACVAALFSLAAIQQQIRLLLKLNKIHLRGNHLSGLFDGFIEFFAGFA
jgi:hypothetical protein